MEIKLWYLTLPGFVSSVLLLLSVLPYRNLQYGPNRVLDYILVFYIIWFALFVILAYIPFRLLYSEKTRKGGAVVSVIYGILLLIFIPVSGTYVDGGFRVWSLPRLLIGMSYLFAGVWYLWKKESVIVI